MEMENTQPMEEALLTSVGLMATDNKEALINMLSTSGVIADASMSNTKIIDLTLKALIDSPKFRMLFNDYIKGEIEDSLMKEANLSFSGGEDFFNMSDDDEEDDDDYGNMSEDEEDDDYDNMSDEDYDDEADDLGFSGDENFFNLADDEDGSDEDDDDESDFSGGDGDFFNASDDEEDDDDDDDDDEANYDGEDFFNMSEDDEEYDDEANFLGFGKKSSTTTPKVSTPAKQTYRQQYGSTRVGDTLRSIFNKDTIGAFVNTGVQLGTQAIVNKQERKGNQQAIDYANAQANLLAQQSKAQELQGSLGSTQAPSVSPLFGGLDEGGAKKPDTKKKWVLPVAIGGGVLVLGTIVYLVVKK